MTSKFLVRCTPRPSAVGLRTSIISFSFSCIIIIIKMFKKVQKRAGSQRVRETQDEDDTSLSAMGSNPLEISEADNRVLPDSSSHISDPNRQTDVDMNEEEESGLPAKRAVGISKFGARRHRHGGLVH